MGSGREGSPSISGRASETVEVMSSSCTALRGTRIEGPAPASIALNTRRSGGKEVVERETEAPHMEAFNSTRWRSCKAAADVAPAGDSDGYSVGKISRKGPTRSNSAGSTQNLAMKGECVGTASEAKLDGHDDWNASTGMNVRSLSFSGGIRDLKEKETVDVGEKSTGPTLGTEFNELQVHSNEYGRLPRSKMVKRSTRRTRGVSQESFQDLVMEPISRSQSRVRDSKVTRSRTVTLNPNRSEEDDLQDILADMVYDEQNVTLEKRSHIRVSKSIRQRSQTESQDLSVDVSSKIPVLPFRSLVGAETQGETQIKATGCCSKSTRRHIKRKPDETNDHSSEEAPELAIADHPPSIRFKEPPQQASRMPGAGASASTSSNSSSGTWIQLLGDVIMWKDIPRSTLYFGTGCFGILSTAYVKNLSFGALTVTCYLALVYLAGIYFHRSYLGGVQVGDGASRELSDSDVLDMIRVVLPAVNLVINKCGQLFCGDPYTTLKVAAMLWVLAQLGYWISLWTFVRLGFVAIFIVPKLFSYYSYRLQRHAEAVAEHVWTAWEDYAHKKAATVGAFLVTWNFTSTSTRLFGAFMMLVACRAYYRQLDGERISQASLNVFEANHLEEVLSPIESGLQEPKPRSHSPLKEVKMET